jgi:hypothetical protein
LLQNGTRAVYSKLGLNLSLTAFALKGGVKVNSEMDGSQAAVMCSPVRGNLGYNIGSQCPWAHLVDKAFYCQYLVGPCQRLKILGFTNSRALPCLLTEVQLWSAIGWPCVPGRRAQPPVHDSTTLRQSWCKHHSEDLI